MLQDHASQMKRVEIVTAMLPKMTLTLVNENRAKRNNDGM